MIASRRLSVAALLSVATLPASAQAQDLAGSTREQPRHGDDHILAGIGVVATPAYQGSDDGRILPIPIVDIASGRFFANFRNGVGLNVIDTGGFTVGGSIAIMPGYRSRDVPAGVDRVTIGAGARLFANLKMAGATLTIGATQGFAGSTGGAIADASIAYPIVASRRLVIIPSIGTTWADGRHTDGYFGISRAESLASGLPLFRPGGGFKDVSAGITVNYRLTERMNVTASAIGTRLLGEASRSPLVRERTQPTGFLSLTYALGR